MRIQKCSRCYGRPLQLEELPSALSELNLESYACACENFSDVLGRLPTVEVVITDTAGASMLLDPYLFQSGEELRLPVGDIQQPGKFSPVRLVLALLVEGFPILLSKIKEANTMIERYLIKTLARQSILVLL